MKFKSTRGLGGVSFEEAVLSGCASDGGMFMPEIIPTISREQMKTWATLTYPQVVEKVMRMCVDQEELSDQEILEVMTGCYSRFDRPEEVVTTVPVGPLMFAELWHGPTGAFKDLSLAILARVVDLFLKKRNKRSVILVSTSGDTGSAAIHSVAGMERVHIMVMYPRHMVSRTQELQMTTVSSPNAHVFSVDGTSDDTDVVIAKLFADSDFAKEYSLNVFNSPNICRLLVQMAHFIYLYLQLCPEVDQDVLFCVPTGGLGNISSGMLARGMGFPIKFLAAVNDNDSVRRTLTSGVYEVPPTVHKTLSCAMDISVPYNMERLFYYFSGGKSDVVTAIMSEFEENGKCVLPKSLMDTNTCVSSVCVSGEEVVSTMKEVWSNHGYLICPHTAVAARAALDLVKRRCVMEEGTESVATSSPLKPIVICTATPAKFAEAVKKAGLALPPSPMFDALGTLPERKLYMNKDEDWCQVMKQAIRNLHWN